MNDLQIQQGTQLDGLPRHSQLTAELGKMLGLVAPVTMSADQQALWLASAVDALADIRPSEVAEVSMEVRRTVTRPSQIVPEVSRLVAERRNRQSESSRREREHSETLAALPARKHIADRDRSNFTTADWSELNEHLERMGSSVRYGPDGSRIEAAA